MTGPTPGTDTRSHSVVIDAVGELLGRRQPNPGLIAQHLRVAAAR